MAHSRYFAYPDSDAPMDIGPVLRGVLRLDREDFPDAPPYLELTRSTT